MRHFETIETLYQKLVTNTTYEANYHFLSQRYRLCTSREEIIKYTDRFMNHYRVTEGSNTSLITIYASDQVDTKPFQKALDSREVFSMHIGKGDRWNMNAKSMDVSTWLVIYLLNTGTIFLINRIKRVAIILGSMDSFLKEDVFHLIRSVMCRSAEVQGYSIYHAAGVVLNGKGILIVGESGRGKTTTFLELIQAGSKPVSNDRVFIKDKDGPLQMHEWPSFVNTSVGTIQKMPQMRHLLPENLTFDSLEELWHSKIKLPIEPPDFCEMFQVRYQPQHTIDLIVFPFLKPEHTFSTIKPICIDEAYRLFEESCYTPDDPAYLNWHRFVPLDSQVLRDQSQRITERLLKEVPCFRLEGGPSLQDAVGLISKKLYSGVGQ